MLLLLVLVFGLYLAIVQVVAATITARNRGVPARGMILGAAIACCIVFFVVLVADLLFESDENYWYYETDWRLPLLFGSAGVVSLVVLILGPVLGARRRHDAKRSS
jgi:hypothetical protein